MLYADNFLGQPTGLSVCLAHLHDPNVCRAWCCWPAQFLTDCNSPSPKLTALEMREGSSTFVVYMGEPWNDGLVIGPAADLALQFTVPCTPCTSVAWGYSSPCQPSACSPARVHDESPVWVPPRSAKFDTRADNQRGHAKFLPSSAFACDSHPTAPIFGSSPCT